MFMCKKRLDSRDRFPAGMEEYLSAYGWHFNKGLCQHAVSRMKKSDAAGHEQPYQPLPKEKVEEILENFLRNLKKGIDVDGNWVNIVVGEADWVEEGDSILKAKIAVQFDITFEGGIYQDRDIKPMNIGSVG